MTPFEFLYNYLKEIQEFIEIFLTIITICATLFTLCCLWLVIRWEFYINSSRYIKVYHYYPENIDDPEPPDDGERVSNKQGEVINFPPKAS